MLQGAATATHTATPKRSAENQFALFALTQPIVATEQNITLEEEELSPVIATRLPSAAGPEPWPRPDSGHRGRDRSQVQPIRTVRDRASWDDQRAPPEPKEAITTASLLHASTAGGAPSDEQGDEPTPGQASTDGMAEPGSQTAERGQNGGSLVDLDGSDPRLSDYQRRMRGKIDPLWAHAFPKWAALEGRQGRSIVSFVILASGAVTNVVVTRPSGVPEFDDNVRRAILRAAPFDPLPANLRARLLRWTVSFDAMNPVVR